MVSVSYSNRCQSAHLRLKGLRLKRKLLESRGRILSYQGQYVILQKCKLFGAYQRIILSGIFELKGDVFNEMMGLSACLRHCQVLAEE